MAYKITANSLQIMLENDNPKYVEAVIGRALWALFQRQTEDEQTSGETRHHNNIGFAAGDARTGSLTAKYWKKHGCLQDWMVEKWTKRSGRNKYARLCKYHRQLDEIAIQRAQQS